MPKYDEKETKETKAKKADAVTDTRIRSFRNKGMSERDATIAGLTSMQRKEDASSPATAAPTEVEKGPHYPYGLRFTLEDEDLTKLGFSELPPVGGSCKFSIEATPESISSNQNKDGKAHERVEFQITDMKWDGEGSSVEAKAEPEVDEDPAEEVAEDEY